MSVNFSMHFGLKTIKLDEASPKEQTQTAPLLLKYGYNSTSGALLKKKFSQLATKRKVSGTNFLN